LLLERPEAETSQGLIERQHADRAVAANHQYGIHIVARHQFHSPHDTFVRLDTGVVWQILGQGDCNVDNAPTFHGLIESPWYPVSRNRWLDRLRQVCCKSLGSIHQFLVKKLSIFSTLFKSFRIFSKLLQIICQRKFHRLFCETGSRGQAIRAAEPAAIFWAVHLDRLLVGDNLRMLSAAGIHGVTWGYIKMLDWFQFSFILTLVQKRSFTSLYRTCKSDIWSAGGTAVRPCTRLRNFTAGTD